MEWQVSCEFCPWHRAVLTRQEALAKGHAHVADYHGGDPEWTFRVRGVRTAPEPCWADFHELLTGLARVLGQRLIALQDAARPTLCVMCFAPIVQPPLGRPRRTCSALCQHRYHRKIGLVSGDL